jgi:AcrR family transcriptional regulator/DNA-binding MarR family transcriptional regulator
MPRTSQATLGDSALERLTATVGGSGHAQLSEIQRTRILAAMVDVTAERGVGNVTVAHVVARSGVSRRTFYELFEDREDCLLAACEDALVRIAAVVLPAYEAPSRWREKLRAGLAALLQFLEFDRGRGCLVILGTPGAGPVVLDRRRRVLAQIMEVVDRGRNEIKQGEGPPPLTAEGVVGGVLSLIHARMVEAAGASLVGDTDASLIELLGPLMSMLVLPYLGPAAARRELAQPAPPTRNGAKSAPGDPLRDLEMRLTYRTIRVLLAVGELGGVGSYPSNRQVGDAAGIRDQGQISKLLTRLQQLGLIENARGDHAKGGPNAWTLTERGANVREVVSP